MPLLHFSSLSISFSFPLFFLCIFRVYFGVFFFFGLMWHHVVLAISILMAPYPASSRAHSGSSRGTKAKGKQGTKAGHLWATSVQVHMSNNDDLKELPAPAPAKGAQHVQWNHAQTKHLIKWLKTNPED